MKAINPTDDFISLAEDYSGIRLKSYQKNFLKVVAKGYDKKCKYCKNGKNIKGIKVVIKIYAEGAK